MTSSFASYPSATCDQFMQAPAGSAPRMVTVAFIRGAVTAYNAYFREAPVKTNLQAAAVESYVEKFCKLAPRADAGHAAFPLIKQLGGVSPADTHIRR